jgi:hypothetical protein
MIDRRIYFAAGASALLTLMAAPGSAAVRTCKDPVTSGPQSAGGISQAQKLAITAWAKAAGIAGGERFTSWRIATTKSLTCGPGPDSKIVCEARGVPCVLQAPGAGPAPKVIPVAPVVPQRKLIVE